MCGSLQSEPYYLGSRLVPPEFLETPISGRARRVSATRSVAGDPSCGQASAHDAPGPALHQTPAADRTKITPSTDHKRQSMGTCSLQLRIITPLSGVHS